MKHNVTFSSLIAIHIDNCNEEKSRLMQKTMHETTVTSSLFSIKRVQEQTEK